VPRLAAGIEANDSPSLRIRIPRPPMECSEVGHSVLLEVGVVNHSHATIERGRLELSFRTGHGLQLCDSCGGPLDEGKLVSPAVDEPSFDRWAIDGARFAGGGSRLNFHVRIDEPGAYPLRLRIGSPELPAELALDRTLYVGRAEGDRTPEESVSALIDQGEAIAGPPPDVLAGSELHREAGAFVLSSVVAVLDLERPELRRQLDEAPVDHRGPKAGDDYLRALVRSRVRALYDIRRQLDRR
jgi:hypothetical protein